MGNSAKKVLFFTTHFHPYKGGLENYVLALSKKLSKKTKVGVVTLKHKPLSDFSRYEGINIYRLDSNILLPGVYEIPKISKKNLQRISKLMKEYDVIITQTRFFSTSVLGAILAKRYNKKYIHTEHGNVFVKHDNKIVEVMARLLDETLGRFVFKSSDVTVGISKPCRNFAKRMGAKKTTLIYNGLDLTKFKHPSKNVKNNLMKKYNPKKKKVVTFVGRLIYAKGVHDLIRACSGLYLKLFVIGDGPYKKKLERLSKQLRVDTKFFGEKSQDEIIRLLSISNVFVNPSYSEGLPTSVLEAAAMGVPVIATDVGGTKDIVRKGTLFKPKNIKSLHFTIRRYLQRQPKIKEDLKQFDMKLISDKIYGLL